MSLRSDVLTWLSLNGYPANVAFKFDEGSGTPTDAISGTKQPNVGGTPSWQTDGTYGAYYRFDATGDNLGCLTTSGGANNFGLFCGTTAETIILLRKKTDTTTRTGFSFAANVASDGGRASCHLPYTDNEAYWDFGGVAAPNRVHFTYTVTTNWELWVFKAGTQGSKIFLDTVIKTAPSTTPITRTANEGTFNINAAFLAGGDLQGMAFIAFIPYEVPDDIIQQLSLMNFSTTSIMDGFVPPNRARRSHFLQLFRNYK